MKLTKTKLKQIIKEELQAVLKEINWETAAAATEPEASETCDELDAIITSLKDMRDNTGLEGRLEFGEREQSELADAELKFRNLKCKEKIKLSQKMGVEPSSIELQGALAGTRRAKALKRYPRN